ncbi:PREDICTED: SH3 domain-binding glutamic acid-rich protein homolog [Priapulus caudatus]|uniref:SH3 domain-binding glutamic acid-rich protein homolog n=1 Tax=Priapulus caudatus TaxID=37621 RepID=A0ABM1EVC4_PRICU|nr:PREDICTED: SH3 domain-binding glutamic acid-rich protein homolog [Priapulus caudatus]
MVLKVYTSGSSGNTIIKGHQQKVLLTLDSYSIPYENIDITAPENKDARNTMLKNAKTTGNNKVPFCPQFFEDEEYIGVRWRHCLRRGGQSYVRQNRFF